MEDLTTLTDEELFDRLEKMTLSIAAGNSPDPLLTSALMRTIHEIVIILETRYNAL